ncbi:MAG TPA: hypothetical protein VGW37_11595 [Terriglobia bacterium]|nr:hypothetical protein [Terriglobia bacterium]
MTRKIALEWDQNSSLRKFSSMDDDAAEVLARYEDADLDLLGLTSLSLPAARALVRQKSGSIVLNGLTSLEDSLAGVFSKYEGNLGLEGLTSLSELAARALTQSVQSLDLSGLTSVADPVAEVLSKCRGRVALRGLTRLSHAGLAVKLAKEAEEGGELDFPGLTELSDPAATALAKTQARLSFGGLKPGPNFDLAWKLFLQDKDSYPLSLLPSLSISEAEVVSNYHGDVYFDSLTKLTDEAAAVLARHVGVLGLRGLVTLTAEAAESLSHHGGILIIPPALSAEVNRHFVGRHIGIGPKSNQLPLLDGAVRATGLQIGKVYDCTIDGELGRERCRVVQLAIDATSNRRFMLTGPSHLFAKYSDFIRRLAGVDFYLLETENFESRKDWIDGFRIWECVLDTSGLIKVSGYDWYLDGFAETDVAQNRATEE